MLEVLLPTSYRFRIPVGTGLTCRIELGGRWVNGRPKHVGSGHRRLAHADVYIALSRDAPSCSGPITSDAGIDYIGVCGTTLAENIGTRGTTLRENGPTLRDNSPITSVRNHIKRECPSGSAKVGVNVR
jgi:hypothetical protein